MCKWKNIDAATKLRIAGNTVKLRLSDGNEVVGAYDPYSDYGNGAFGVTHQDKHFAIRSDDEIQPVAYCEIERKEGEK